MCRSDDLKPGAGRISSTISASTGYGERNGSSPRELIPKKDSRPYVSLEELPSLAWLSAWVLAGVATSAAVTGFALWFPFVLAPEAANKTYDWAFYTYDEKLSHFDNTVWTYGSDYVLAVTMAALATSILRYCRHHVSDRLCYRSAALLLSYCVSVSAGGFCHQNYKTLESRNTPSFQLLWTICVGSVTVASAFMGISGTEVIRQFQRQPNCSPSVMKIPLIPEAFWWSFGIVVTAVCAWGGMSFQRPACDIFIAGITQAPSTFYLMTFFSAVQHRSVHLPIRAVGIIGFILNAPLLPMYPLLIQYTDWSLASVNSLLHTWLCVAWSMQGFSLLQMIHVLVETTEEKHETKVQ